MNKYCIGSRYSLDLSKEIIMADFYEERDGRYIFYVRNETNIVKPDLEEVARFNGCYVVFIYKTHNRND